MIKNHNIEFSDSARPLPPLSYKEVLFLWKDSKMVFTDSGGLQEETIAIGVPCITIRNNTERPITIEMGTNVLAGTNQDGILKCYREVMGKNFDIVSVPPGWDGHAAIRIWDTITSIREKEPC